ncbi:thioredoxin fold domain-containing protein [Aerolutibacter daejeonensis]|uniref:thioredoxin fold domain-containing protein n=1 Tax=Aerolutibacter daejeonensis TaxID=346181 RepID=UPI000A04EB66|nr:thioredoxin fold domain-containing protein [Lysobacter daejeonensis]
MKRILIAALGAISLSACAQQAPQSAQAPGAQAASANAVTAAKPIAGTPEARAVDAIRQLNPQVTVEKVAAAPVPGFREAIVGGQVVYISDDGKYLFLPGSGGALFDVGAKKNLSEVALSGMRVDLLKTIPASERIVFAPPNPKYTVTVFTDVECGYCRKLHSEIAEYNRQGIAIEYLAFPRMGIGSEDHKKMVSVWCAADRKKALTDAKSDKALKMVDCKNTVTMQYDVGQRAGLTGTPMILTKDGTQVGGYLPPAQLRATLDRLAGEGAKPAAAAPAAATPSDPVKPATGA